MHPESPLVNNPVTAGPWISTTQMSSDLPALLSSQDSKGKGKAVPTGRDVPILDGLVAAIEVRLYVLYVSNKVSSWILLLGPAHG